VVKNAADIIHIGLRIGVLWTYHMRQYTRAEPAKVRLVPG
jgi:hypothetical protein